MSILDHFLHASKGLFSCGDLMGDLIVDFGAAGEIAAQVHEGINRFQLGAIEIDLSCGVIGIGRRLMHHNHFFSVDVKSNVVPGGSQEVHAPLHFLFCHCNEYADISEEKFVNGGCGDTRAEVHPSLVEELAIYLVGDADPGALVKPVAIHRVKGFCLIHEGSVEVSQHLPELLLQLVGGKDHVDCSSVSSEATLAFLEQTLLQVSVQAIEENAGEDLSGDVQQRDS
ncbi:unnamed protein product [Schistocephalus solidus]|uniref:Uncharacterized protein n=1 Tax=Schistocephalus solidus TaxID=70667 RepID=A0A183T0F9_SCHSO|nr:unnamed protein product [Schistocephalus solidus]